MTPAIIFAMNNRPRQSRLFMLGLNRLRKVHPHLLAFACVTHPDDEALCAEFGVEYAQSPNVPSDKFNVALALAMSSSATHFIVMGDDDLLSDAGLDLLIHYAEQGNHYCGFKTNGFYDLKTGKAMTHTQPFKCNKLIGAGRMMSRNAIVNTCRKITMDCKRDFDKHRQGDKIIVSPVVAEYLEGYGLAKSTGEHFESLWPAGMNKTLDFYSETKLVMAGFTPVCVDDDRIHVVDVKDIPHNNIWPMSILERKCKPSTFEKVMWFLSEEEKEYIRDINQNNN